jgi:NitT/TauT family transport system substrate-binding protein
MSHGLPANARAAPFAHRCTADVPARLSEHGGRWRRTALCVWDVLASFAVGVALVIAAAPPAVAASEKLSLRLDWTPHGMHAPIFLAVEKGWFQRAGLDVTIEDGNGSVIAAQLVGAGQFDIGHASLSSVAIARGKGLPVTSVAGFIRKSDMGVLVPVGSGWKTAKDLEGKKVAYTAGSLEGPFVDAFFGASKSKVELLNVDAATKIGTYLSGSAEAVISTVPYVLPIVAAKRPSEGILFASAGLDLPGFGMFTTNAKLKDKGDALRRLTSVVAGGWNYIFDGHIDEGVQAILKNRSQLPLNSGVLKGQVEAYKAYFYSDATKDKPIGIQAEADWAKTIKVMEDAGVLKKGSRPGDYFTNDFFDPQYLASLLK